MMKIFMTILKKTFIFLIVECNANHKLFCEKTIWMVSSHPKLRLKFIMFDYESPIQMRKKWLLLSNIFEITVVIVKWLIGGCKE